MFRSASLRVILCLAARAAGLILTGLLVAPTRGQTVISGTYNGVTIAGDISMTTETTATFTGGTTFTGANATFGVNAALTWQQDGTLDNKVLTFAAGGRIYIGSNRTLTLGSKTVATGNVWFSPASSSYLDTATFSNQGTIANNAGDGRLYRLSSNTGSITTSNGSTLQIGEFGTAYSFSTVNGNGGTITADGLGSAIYLNTALVNQGTLIAQNSGSLIFRPAGDQPITNLGVVQIASGGHVYLRGGYVNTGNTLNPPSGGSFELDSGSINGGTIAPGAVTFTSAGGTLYGVTLTGDFTLGQYASVEFDSGTNFTGSKATLGPSSLLRWGQTGTLSDKTLVFSPGARISDGGFQASLTLGPTTTATGSVRIGAYSVTNQGTIDHNNGVGGLGGTFLNSGTITASSGSQFYIGYTNNAYVTTNGSGGTITADGAGTTVTYGNIVNQGRIVAQNGAVLIFNTDYQHQQTTANLGTLELATGGRAYLTGFLDNTDAVLTAPTGGKFELQGGQIANGSIAEDALLFTAAGGRLTHAVLSGNLILPAGASLVLESGASFGGTSAFLAENSHLTWLQTGTLNDKVLTFEAGSYVEVANSYSVLTLGPTSAATGNVTIYSQNNATSALTGFINQGTIAHTSGGGRIYANTFTNAGRIIASNGSTLDIGNLNDIFITTINGPGGTITADGAKTVVYLNNNFANQGTFIAQNAGQLIFRNDFRAAWTTNNLGLVQIVNGGHAYLSGNLNNTGATLVAPTGGSFELYGGVINNGTIAAGALTFTSSGGTLNNTTLNGDFTLPGNAVVGFAAGATFTGATASLGGTLRWAQSGTLADKAITFGPGAIVSLLNLSALTLGPTTTVTGEIKISLADLSSNTSFTNQGTLTHTSGTGSLIAHTLLNSGNITGTLGTVLNIGTSSSNYAITNGSGGTITADGTNSFIYLNGNIANQGTLIAKNSGQLVFRTFGTPAMLTANLGAIQIANGGHVYLGGTLNNTGATLTAVTGGSFELYGGTINNGIVASGALAYTSAGGTLNNVSVLGDLTLAANAQVNFTGGTTFTGTNLTLESSTIAGSSSLFRWLQSGTLDGKALNFGTNSLLTVGSGNSLTLGPASRMNGSVSMLSNDSGSTIINQGTITHSAGAGRVYAQTFTNSGSIVVTGGQLSVGSFLSGWTFNNTADGLIRTTGGGTVIFTAPGSSQIVNNGRIDVQGGAVDTHDHLTNGAGGVISGGGTILNSLTMAGGTIAPGNSVGTLGFVFGTLNVTGASVFAVELSGASSDQLVFNNPPSAVSLGTGLLTLSLTLLAPPTEGTTYNLIRIASGSSGITGTFAGLPSSGNTITAVYADTTYTFGVNYAPNLVSLNFATIPEPSTYVLLGMGAVLLALWRKRGRKR